MRASGLALASTLLGTLLVAMMLPQPASAECGAGGGQNDFEWSGKLEDVLTGLESGVVAERIQTVRCLAEFPAGQVTSNLVQMLQREDSIDVRLAVVDALRVLRARESTGELLELLGERDADLRIAAATALGEMGAREAVSKLTTLLSDASGDVRVAAVRALGALRDPTTIPSLTAMLSDDTKDVVVEALMQLSRFSDATTVYALLDKTHDSAIKIRTAAVKALAKLRDPRATSTLVSMLRGQPADVRREAVRALEAIGDPEAVEPLLALLNPSEGHDSLAHIIRALGVLGDERAVAPLLSLLRHGHGEGPILSALTAIGAPAVDTLIDELESTEDPSYQRQLLRALARIPSSRSSDVLEAALRTDAFVDTDVVHAIAQIRHPEMLETLTLVIPQLNEQDVLRVVNRILYIADDRVVLPLAERYPSAGKELRVAILSLFARVGDPAAASIVAEELGNDDLDIKRHAIFAAQSIRDPSTLPGLMACLRSDDATIRHQSSVALAMLENEDIPERLLRVAMDESHPARRDAMWALAFATRGGEADDAVEFAIEVLETPSHSLAYTALELLGTHQPPETSAILERVFRQGRTSIKRKAIEIMGFPASVVNQEIIALGLAGTDRGIVAESAWVAGRLGSEQDLAPLRALSDSRDSAVATNAITSLGRLGDAASAELFHRRLYDTSPFVAASSLWSLQQLGAEYVPERWELELILTRSENPFLRETTYRALLMLGETEAIRSGLSREPVPALEERILNALDHIEPLPADSWAVLDLGDRSSYRRMIAQRAFLLLPDGSIKAAFSDENGKIRLEMENAGRCLQLYDEREFEPFGGFRRDEP